MFVLEPISYNSRAYRRYGAKHAITPICYNHIRKKCYIVTITTKPLIPLGFLV